MKFADESCSCGVTTWREIRTTLRLTREEMAALLHCSIETVRKIELLPHRHCPHSNTVRFLQSAVRRRPEYRRVLAARPGVYPFLEDLSGRSEAG